MSIDNAKTLWTPSIDNRIKANAKSISDMSDGMERNIFQLVALEIRVNKLEKEANARLKCLKASLDLPS